MRLIKIFLTGFLAVLTLVIAGGIYAVQHFPNWLHDQVGEVGNKIGYVIDFNNFSYSIRDAHVHFSNLKVVHKANHQQLISLGDFDVRFKWQPLWQKKVEIQSIAMNHLELDITKDPQLNFAKLIEDIEKVYPPSPAPSNSAKPWRFQIEKLDIDQAQIHLNLVPRQLENAIQLDQIHVRNIVNFDEKGAVNGNILAAFALAFKPQQWHYQGLNKSLDASEFVLKGDVSIAKNSDATIHTEYSADQNSQNNFLADISYINDTDDIFVDAQLKRLSLVPFLQMEFKKSTRSSKTGEISGKLHFESTAKGDALKADFFLENLNVSPLLEVLPANILLVGKSGVLGAHVLLDYDDDHLKLSGQTLIKDLAIYGVDQTSELLAWKSGLVKNFEFFQSYKKNDTRLKVDEIELDGLKAIYTIYADKSSNFRRIFPPSAKESKRLELARQIATIQDRIEQSGLRASPEEEEQLDTLRRSQKKLSEPQTKVESASEFTADIKSIAFRNSQVRFTDFSVRPNFKAEITNLRGTLIGISTEPKRYATAALEGLVAPHGDVKINGQIAFEGPRRNNHVELSFHRIPLNSINPYYTNLAGYDVIDGTLSYDSIFDTKDGELVSENRFVINNIVLGEQNPNYKGTFLPMKLITSLLEDKDGIIDLNLSIKGNVDSPEFEISKLLWDAFYRIVGNVVKSPFIAISKLLGIENVKGVYFNPGSSQLRPSEVLKLEKMAASLEQRPKLKLRVYGTFDNDADARAIAMSQVNLLIFKRAGFSMLPNEPLPQLPLADDRIQKVLDQIVIEQAIEFPQMPTQKDGLTREKYYQILYEKLLQGEKVVQQQLVDLAQERIQKIEKELLKQFPQLRDRLQFEGSKEAILEADGIPMEMAFVN